MPRTGDSRKTVRNPPLYHLFHTLSQSVYHRWLDEHPITRSLARSLYDMMTARRID